jgi:hypothetical protein
MTPMNAMNMNMPMQAMGGMPMMNMPMQAMNGMPMMNMPPQMGMGMPMMMPMMMPMPMMAPMMCRMTCEMSKDGMVCKMMPMDAGAMEMMKERCEAINATMAMGAPMMMMVNGMPMMVCMPK